MLSTLFNAIQSALGTFTRGFLVVAYIPVILFVAANAALLRVVSPGDYRFFFDSLQFPKTADGGPLLLWIVATAAAALLLGATQPFLFHLTEGDYLPSAIRRWRLRSQQARLDRMRHRAAAAWDRRDQLEKLSAHWREALDFQTDDQHNPVGGREPTGAEQSDWDALATLRATNAEIDIDRINTAVEQMNDALQTAGLDPPPDGLRDERRLLLRVIGYAHDKSLYDYRQAQNEVQAQFPGDVFDPNPSADNILAPTTFGNIGRTMRSYALRRYGLDLDIFWNRLQKVMADSKDSKMFDSLQGQKTQVDFLLNLFWLTVVTGAIWIPALMIEGIHRRGFLTVVIAAPLLSWFLYGAACRSYLVFADQVRTAVDFFRWDILSGLRIKPPAHTEDEEALWERLGNRIGYARKDATFLYGPKS